MVVGLPGFLFGEETKIYFCFFFRQILSSPHPSRTKEDHRRSWIRGWDRPHLWKGHLEGGTTRSLGDFLTTHGY